MSCGVVFVVDTMFREGICVDLRGVDGLVKAVAVARREKRMTDFMV